MSRAKPTAAEILTLITERAESLRRAGVTSVTVDNFSVELAPYEPPATATPGDRDATAADDPIDPLHDGATYAGGRVPGFVLDEEPVS